MPDTRYEYRERTAEINLSCTATAFLSANVQPDPKKQGKEKKPGFHRVGLVFLDE
jgi:uncharacterized protein YdeI (BOF family)